MKIPTKWVYWAIVLFVIFFLYKAGFLNKKQVSPIDIGRFSYQDSDLLLTKEYP